MFKVVQKIMPYIICLAKKLNFCHMIQHQMPYLMAYKKGSIQNAFACYVYIKEGYLSIQTWKKGPNC